MSSVPGGFDHLMSLAMTTEEREAFLAGVHVGVLSVAGGDGRAPLSLPIWYLYEPGGEIRFITGEHSSKARLLQAAGRASLCVQTEDPPYRYVTVEGSLVAVEQPVDPTIRRTVARRYLGVEGGDAWAAAMDGSGSVFVRLRPERWLSADFSKEYS